MTTDEVRNLLHAAPFVPLTIYLPSDRSFRIEHPDFAMLSRGGRILVVDREVGGVVLVDLMLATHIETHPPASQGTPS